MDSSSQDDSVQKHKGLMWIVNNGKYDTSINEQDAKESNVLYLANEFNGPNKNNQLEKVIFLEKGKTVIAEFNTFAGENSQEENAELLNAES